MSFEEGWLCSSKTCVYKRKKELLVVVSLEDVETFKWLRIYHYKDTLKDGEYLFWCVVTSRYKFILLDEFELQSEYKTYQGSISRHLVTMFDKTKMNKVETFGAQMDALKKLQHVLTF